MRLTLHSSVGVQNLIWLALVDRRQGSPSYGEVVWRGEPFPNLLLDAGLRNLWDVSSARLAYYCALGAGASSVSPQDQQLAQEVVRGDHHVAGACGTRIEGTTVVHFRTWQFPATEERRIFREVGFSHTASPPGVNIRAILPELWEVPAGFEPQVGHEFRIQVNPTVPVLVNPVEDGFLGTGVQYPCQISLQEGCVVLPQHPFSTGTWVRFTGVRPPLGASLGIWYQVDVLDDARFRLRQATGELVAFGDEGELVSVEPAVHGWVRCWGSGLSRVTSWGGVVDEFIAALEPSVRLWNSGLQAKWFYWEGEAQDVSVYARATTWPQRFVPPAQGVGDVSTNLLITGDPEGPFRVSYTSYLDRSLAPAQKFWAVVQQQVDGQTGVGCVFPVPWVLGADAVTKVTFTWDVVWSRS